MIGADLTGVAGVLWWARADLHSARWCPSAHPAGLLQAHLAHAESLSVSEIERSDPHGLQPCQHSHQLSTGHGSVRPTVAEIALQEWTDLVSFSNCPFNSMY